MEARCESVLLFSVRTSHSSEEPKTFSVSSFDNGAKISTAQIITHSNVTGVERNKEQCGEREAIIRQVNRGERENRLELCVLCR